MLVFGDRRIRTRIYIYFTYYIYIRILGRVVGGLELLGVDRVFLGIF